MIKYLDVEQNSPIWLDLRKHYIGSSDAPIILGSSPWKTRRELWEEKIGLIEPDNIETKAMKRGKELEPIARQAASELLAMPLFPKVAINSKFPWMIASVDAISEDGKTLIEIKCPSNIDHDSALAGCIPKKYIPQLYHQMIVLELKTIKYYSYSEDKSIMIDLEYDEDFGGMLIEKEREFWDCVLSLTPPSFK